MCVAALYILQHRAYKHYCLGETRDAENLLEFEDWCCQRGEDIPQFHYWATVLELELMPSVLFLLAAVVVAAEATVVSRLYYGSGLQDKAFTQNVVFTSPAKRAVHCSMLCNQHELCDTFTLEQDLCKGHALELTSDTPYVFAAAARSFSMSKLEKKTSCPKKEPEGSRSGVVTIYPDNVTPLQVYRDEDTDCGGWTVFQRRVDGSVDFFRNWTEYQKGFGDLTGNFWLGLDALHMLTSRQRYELRVDLMLWNGTMGYATYSNFTISNSIDNYRLNYGSFTGGTVADGMVYDGMQFTTRDRDNDASNWQDFNCAEKRHGAWWYLDCSYANLNGKYMPNSNDPDAHGIIWFPFGGNEYSLKFSEMKIRVA
ncbi:microfibril-associated glycoprotein 4-like [Littorina saxatilis]|uniref:microfibril-associated glycoprotein 4-like n=1 Tax=Littorina saxatilis TaxID=31220 RepID=UPI0038B5F6E7